MDICSNVDTYGMHREGISALDTSINRVGIFCVSAISIIDKGFAMAFILLLSASSEAVHLN